MISLAASFSPSQTISSFGTIRAIPTLAYSWNTTTGWINWEAHGDGTKTINPDGYLNITTPSGGNMYQGSLIHLPIDKLPSGITAYVVDWSAGTYSGDNNDKMNVGINYCNGLSELTGENIRWEFHLMVHCWYPKVTYITDAEVSSGIGYEITIPQLSVPTMGYNNWHQTIIYIDFLTMQYVAVSLDGVLVDMRGISGCNLSDISDGQSYKHLTLFLESYSASSSISTSAFISSVKIYTGLTEQDLFE